MKMRINIDDVIVEYSIEEEIYYSCYIKEHDIYFSSRVEKGMDMIIKKTRAMIQAKENFIREYPEYNK